MWYIIMLSAQLLGFQPIQVQEGSDSPLAAIYNLPGTTTEKECYQQGTDWILEWQRDWGEIFLASVSCEFKNTA